MWKKRTLTASCSVSSGLTFQSVADGRIPKIYCAIWILMGRCFLVSLRTLLLERGGLLRVSNFFPQEQVGQKWIGILPGVV